MYYTAEGLRELTIKNVIEGKNNNIKNALLIAQNQANLGYFEANIPFELTAGEVKFLEDIGYKLEKIVRNIIGNVDVETEINYYISW